MYQYPFGKRILSFSSVQHASESLSSEPWILNGDHNEVLKFAAGLVVFATIVFFRPHKKVTKKNRNDSPPRVPLTEREALIGLGGINKPWFLLDMMEKTGSDIYALTSNRHVVGDYKTTREILLDQTTVKPAFYKVYAALFGSDNMFAHTENDQFWHNVRKSVNRSMSSNEVNRMNRICAEHLDNWIKNTLEPCIANNETFDPTHEMSRITFKVISEATFEYHVTDEEYESFCHHLDIGKKEIQRMGFGNPLRKWYAPILVEHKVGMKSLAEVQAFGRKILNSYRENSNKSTNNTVIKMLEIPGVCVDDTQRIAEINTLFVSGHHTTADSISSALLLLTKNPKIQSKLQSTLGSMDSASRSKCQYMRDVITESNRLLPSTPLGSIRQLGRDFSCKDGSMTIPKGTEVYMPQILLHRNPGVFKNPADFIPERWENATEAMKSSMMTFSIGKRNCPGQSLALAEMYCILPKLLAEYKLELEDEGKLECYTTMGYIGARLKASKI